MLASSPPAGEGGGAGGGLILSLTWIPAELVSNIPDAVQFPDLPHSVFNWI